MMSSAEVLQPPRGDVPRADRSLPFSIVGGGGGDRWFVAGTTLMAVSTLALFGLLVALLLTYAWPALVSYGLSFFTTAVWDPVFQNFGAAHFIYGTLVTSVVALLIAAPIGVGAALFVAEYAPEWLREPVSFMVELLAVIPSIIYGLWGFFVLAPIMRRNVEPALQDTLGQLPIVGALFSGPILGKDLLIGGVILAIMILPTIMAISREVLRAVPNTQREGMLALGATTWEAIRYAVLPYAQGGMIGAAGLGLARALGETMAVTLVRRSARRCLRPAIPWPAPSPTSSPRRTRRSTSAPSWRWRWRCCSCRCWSTSWRESSCGDSCVGWDVR
jgi:phosphate transport system permease protein